jgi:hypothetical protein
MAAIPVLQQQTTAIYGVEFVNQPQNAALPQYQVDQVANASTYTQLIQIDVAQWQQELAQTIQDPKSLATMQQLAIDLSTYASSQSLYWAYWYFRYLTTPVQLMIIEAVSLGNTSDLDGSAFMRQYQTNVAILSLLDPSNRVAQEYVKAVQLFQLGNVLPTLVDFSGTETDDVVFDIQLILGGMTDNYRGSSNQDIRYAADAAGALTQD